MFFELLQTPCSAQLFISSHSLLSHSAFLHPQPGDGGQPAQREDLQECLPARTGRFQNFQFFRRPLLIFNYKIWGRNFTQSRSVRLADRMSCDWSRVPLLISCVLCCILKSLDNPASLLSQSLTPSFYSLLSHSHPLVTLSLSQPSVHSYLVSTLIATSPLSLHDGTHWFHHTQPTLHSLPCHLRVLTVPSTTCRSWRPSTSPSPK